MRALYTALGVAVLTLSAAAPLVALVWENPWLMFVLLVYVLLNIVPSPDRFGLRSMRLRICAEGADLLLVFLISTVLWLGLIIPAGFACLGDSATRLPYIFGAAAGVAVLTLTFWNGILRVYLTSVQLGIKRRVVCVICAFFPVANLVALCFIIAVVYREVALEDAKTRLNEARADEKICATRYPLLLVHGVFFRDFNAVNYWGRIPAELQRNGATVYYGNHQSASSVADSAEELTARIRDICAQTGCEKVNIIAHSKGGLDCRYAIARCGAAPYVASLTTINTPHRGCLFADYLLDMSSVKLKNSVARTYNRFLRRLGDSKPDFLAAVYDLTGQHCADFNRVIADDSGVYYQSFGSVQRKARSGKLPLNLTYHLAKTFSGENDGLVAVSSFEWGSRFRLLTPTGKRGISHGDMIDLNRENIPGFDVREFYVQMVAELKKRGL